MGIFAQRNFGGGEVAPAIYPQTDLLQRQRGLRLERNTWTRDHGGTQNRPGTSFIEPIKNQSSPARLIPFIFNTTTYNTYVLEFGQEYIRFYQNGEQITVSGVAAWVNTTAYSIGSLVVSGGINYYSLQNGNVGNTPSSSPTYWYPLTGNIYEIPSPYAVGDVSALTLKFAQDADVVSFAHPSYPPYDLVRNGQTFWTMAPTVFGASVLGPTGVSNSGASPAPGVVWSAQAGVWIVSSVSALGEESTIIWNNMPTPPIPYGVTVSSTTPASGTPVTITWTAPSSGPAPVYYNIYRLTYGGVWGFLGTTPQLQFTDNGITPDVSQPWILPRAIFNAANIYPGTVAFAAGRKWYGYTNTLPTDIEASQTDVYDNFNVHLTPEDSDGVSAQLAGSQDAIQNFMDLDSPIVFTAGREVALLGNSNGVVTPGNLGDKTQSKWGSSPVAPVNANGYAIYVQSRGSAIRDLGYIWELGGYRGNDITWFAKHLFEGHTVVDMAFQKVPNPIVWVVRSDGLLLSCTYVKEENICAWAHHDFQGGSVESICVVPEGGEDFLYLTIKRTINGSSCRYVERLNSRLLINGADQQTPGSYSILDSIFMDSATTIDGRNTGGITMELTGGTNWTYQEVLTCTASSASFSSGDVGNAVQLFDSEGNIIRFSILGYTSSTVVTGQADRTVPTDLRSTATTLWAKAIKTVTGLSYLDGEEVSVFADGFVVASPYNPNSPNAYTVSGGSITLDRPYAVIHVGLPYLSDFESLDVDNSYPLAPSLADKRKIVEQLWLSCENTRGIWVGPQPPTDDETNAVSGLQELKIRQYENYDQPVRLATETVEVPLYSKWNKSGRVFVRQVDPLPVAVNAIAMAGNFPMKAGA